MNSKRILIHNQKEYLEQIRYYFSILSADVSLSNSQNFQDVNNHLEDTMCRILNAIYGDRMFRNLNPETSVAKGIDLGDNLNDISIQVTSNSKPQKVRSTYTKFIERGDYRRLIMLYLTDRKPQRISDFRNYLSENKIEEWDFQTLMGKIRKLELENLKRLFHVITGETNIRLDLVNEKSLTDIPPNFFVSHLIENSRYITRYIQKPSNTNTADNSPILLTDLFSKHSNKRELIAILGNVGMGKTVELQQTAISIANKDIFYPIYFRLNRYLPGEPLEIRLPDNWDTIPEHLRVILLDGLDEILPEQRLYAFRRILEFADKHPQVHIIVSCRTNFYELPQHDMDGDLKGFDVYFLKELVGKDVVDHINKHCEFDGEAFLEHIYQEGYLDLVFNPFFLELLINNYQHNNYTITRKRSKLISDFIESIFRFDIDHFRESRSLNEEKAKLKTLLRKIAFGMTLMGIRVIHEDQLLEILPEPDDFRLIKFAGIFGISDDGKKEWTFKHGYFQEFLCAELLARQSSEVVLSFVSSKSQARILPGWANTLTLLLSILDKQSQLYTNLITWVIANDVDILVKIEKEQLDSPTIESIFKRIFNYYKELKIWMNTNKFSEKDLAYFAQSTETIQFTLNEAFDKSNDRVVRLNALHIIAGFELIGFYNITQARDGLLNLIVEEAKDPYFTFVVIRTMKDCGFHDRATVNRVMEIAGKRKNQYIRASIYRLLIKSDVFEEYVDYFLEGVNVIRFESTDREGETIFGDERYALWKGIKSFKSTNALLKILGFYIDKPEVIHREYNQQEILTKIIENAAEANAEAPVIFNKILELLLSLVRYHSYNDEIEPVLSFFITTQTKEKAIKDIIPRMPQKDSFIFCRFLALFVEEGNMYLVLDAFAENSLDITSLQRIYNELYINSSLLAQEFRRLAKESQGVNLEVPKTLNWDSIRRVRDQKAFDVLFDFEWFKNESLKLLGDKEEVNFFEVFKANSYKFYNADTDSFIPETVIRFVQEFEKDKVVRKQDVINYFSNPSIFKSRQINLIYIQLKNRINITVSEMQQKFIKDWIDEKIKEVDFHKAISINGGGNVNYSDDAVLISYFVNRFNIEIDEGILLEMLAFTPGDILGEGLASFEYLCVKINNKSKLKDKVLKNIQSKSITIFPIYKNQINFALENSIADAYDIILDDLSNGRFNYWRRNEIIDLWLDKSKDKERIKNIYDALEVENKLHLLKHFTKLGDFKFALDKLLLLHAEVDDEGKLNTINNLLLALGAIEGLILTIEWIEKYKRNPFDQDSQGLDHFTDINALPYLMHLLLLSYDKSIKSQRHMDRLWSIVVRGLEHLALHSEANYQSVIKALKDFIQENKQLDDVNFVNTAIASIEDKYLQIQTTSYTIFEAKKILDDLAM